jgi:hypothetical protein
MSRPSDLVHYSSIHHSAVLGRYSQVVQVGVLQRAPEPQQAMEMALRLGLQAVLLPSLQHRPSRCLRLPPLVEGDLRSRKIQLLTLR